MQQYAPDPVELIDLVNTVKYKPGWHFAISDRPRDGIEAGGLTLSILVHCMDAYHPENERPVVHYFIVPAATYNRDSWRRWLFDRILDVEQHEASEYFQFDGHRPFAPTHGPGDDPYTLVQYATDEQRRTSFRGEVKV